MEFTILPHGGTLCRLLAGAERAERLKEEARATRAVVLSPRRLSDLDLLLNGGFSPLRGFLGRADYESVLDTMRLESGLLWPIPVALDVPEAAAGNPAAGDRLALQDPEDFPHAILTVGDVWHPDRRREAEAVYGTTSDAHPGVCHLYEQGHALHIGDIVSGGRIATPYQKPTAPGGSCRAGLGPPTMHEIPLHPCGIPTVSAGRAPPYQKPTAPGGSCRVGLGPPTVLGIATPSRISANPGWVNPALPAPHHGAPAPDGRFYEPLAAQELLARHESELALRPVPVEELRYVPRRGRYLPAGVIERDAETAADLGEEELRRRLSASEEIPEWFSYPEVIEELRRVYPPPRPSGLYALLHRALRRRQVHAGQTRLRQARRGRRAPRHASRRRHRAPQPLQRTRLLTRAPRPQRAPHRLRWVDRVRDWPHSSFHRFVARSDYPEDWGGGGVGRDKCGYGE